ncbi:MAG: hypothetical protein KatS3mg087_1819 [Patescibacteria group bacterium]|nr:MAG: hypothetical protein KatS3mg087_1819 [Patescibacteria group bacterium]
MDITSWIAGLMAENTNELGFIPDTTIKNRYIAQNNYVLQEDERGKPVGYILHGPIKYGKPVVISQACIQYEKRLRGYGEKAFLELLNRARIVGASSIRLRCADDLPAVQFWQSLGFEIVDVEPGGKSRGRMIFKMVFRLDLPLFR